jgi:phosphoserine phosphatase
MTTIPALDALALIRQLEPLARGAGQEAPGGEGAGLPGALVFDADGTLWTSDVGIDVFVDALANDLLRDEAREALRREVLAHNLAGDVDLDSLDANALGKHLQRAFELGVYAEKPATEMQVWAYAGFTEDELRSHTREALRRSNQDSHIYQPLLPVLIWARDAGLRTVIVSASPQIVVEEAARALDFMPTDIVAGRTTRDGVRLLAELSEPLPYGDAKAHAGRRILGDTPWLATFGDSAFDVAMLSEAKLPVAVRPKPELLAQLPSIPGAVRLLDGM